MIRNIQKIFILSILFSITNIVFCAQSQMTPNDLVPFIEKTRKLYEDLQVSYTSQALTIQRQDEIIQFLQTENQAHTKKIEHLINQQLEQNKINTELIDNTKRLIIAVEKFSLDIHETQKRKVIINSPTGNNNNHSMSVKNTSMMGSVIIGGSSTNTNPSSKALLFHLALIAGGIYVILKLIRID